MSEDIQHAAAPPVEESLWSHEVDDDLECTATPVNENGAGTGSGGGTPAMSRGARPGRPICNPDPRSEPER